MSHTDLADYLHSGELYLPMEDAILQEQLRCLELLYDYNATRPSETGIGHLTLKTV